MKNYFVAGGTRGGNHGAALVGGVQAIPARRGFELLGRGGPRMKSVAGDHFIDWKDEAGVVGLWEVVKHYPYFRREFAKTLAEIRAAQPDAVVLIDYPGFNLRLARALHENSLGGKIIYYISPQVWAWNRARIPKMGRWLDPILFTFSSQAALLKQR